MAAQQTRGIYMKVQFKMVLVAGLLALLGTSAQVLIPRKSHALLPTVEAATSILGSMGTGSDDEAEESEVYPDLGLEPGECIGRLVCHI